MTVDVVYAQRVLLFEDFEDSIPDLPADQAIASLDTFNRSEVLEDDPGTITVTGGQFPDPFTGDGGFGADFNGDGAVTALDLNDPTQGWKARYGNDLNGSDFLTWQCELAGSPCGGSNQSMLLHNPNSAVQQAANWFSIFPEDPADPHFYLKNGAIEYDVFLEQVPADGNWTFLGTRLGFEFNADDRNQVTTEGDQNIWNSFRMQDGGLATEAGNYLFDQVNAVTPEGFGTQFFDENVIVTDRELHVRYEIDGVNGVYSVFIDDLENDDPEVEVIDDLPWTSIFNFQTFQEEPAPGINEVTFITDASSRGTGSLSAGNVYLDNLLIIDNDQAPDGAVAAATAVPEPATACLLLLAASLAVANCRNRCLRH
jgi:hypothetical protein